MAEKKSTEIMVQGQGGMMRDILNRLKLIFRLMGDRRVNFLVKLIPVGTLIYLVSPIDAISIPVVGAIDDAALLWLGSYLFTELCPPDVVEEHLKALAGTMKGKPAEDEVVEGETTEIKDNPD